jgi:UDP-glucose:(glucosyl)LPS alpha-1,2-glucosyltransferase
MSCIHNGNVIESEQSRNAMGGTEMMRSRLLKNVKPELLEGVSIHFSRPRNVYSENKNILYLHDLAEDPENRILLNGGWKSFDHFVFVTNWQRDQYIPIYGIPYSKCTVIENAVEVEHKIRRKPTDKIRLIYHTTPHRGLALLSAVFSTLSKIHPEAHLDVFSSFEAYGWGERDKPFQPLFETLKTQPNVTYHGYQSNKTVLEYLEQSHMFVYPCIWKETSCIAMIEAIRSGCLVVHPNYGALTETSCGATMSYDYSENLQENASRCYSLTKQILDYENSNKGWINNLTNGIEYSLPKNNIGTFTNKWNFLLEQIKNE